MFFGLPALAAASLAFSRLDVTTPDQFIVLVLIIRGLCMGVLFMPLNTAIMNQVPFDKINRGSSLTNAVRQLFASFGVAIVATILSNRQTIHEFNLAETVTATSPMVQRMLGAASAMATQHGWTAYQAKQLLVTILDGQILQQAAVMSFDDSFLVLGVMAILAVIPAAFLRTRTHAAAGMAMPVEM
jgi:DHA2 family multidrug resistance protein